jgi:hypothetical protein
MAKCRWGKAAWILGGEGPWASVSNCPPDITIILHPSQEAAERAKRTIDESACGGRCWGRHRVVNLDDLW